METPSPLSGLLREIAPWANWFLFLLQAAFAVMLALAKNTFQTRAAQAARDASVDDRLQDIEGHMATTVTTEEFTELRLEMKDVQGDIRAFQAEMRGARETFNAQIARADQLVDRTERVVNMITEHLLTQKS